MSLLGTPQDGWVVTASADNATATASKSAPVAGKYHYLTSVHASFSNAVTKLLQVKDNTTVIWEGYVVNGRDVVFGSPLRITVATACSAELAASGTGGQLGKVAIVGFTD